VTVANASSSDVPPRRPGDTIPVIVQGLGYRITHVAEIPVTDLRLYRWDTHPEPNIGIPAPVTAVCDRRVSSRGPIVMVLPRGFLVRCPGCRKRYGLSPEIEAPVPAMRPEPIGWRSEYLSAQEADDGGF
jgi:hypothetical protein